MSLADLLQFPSTSHAFTELKADAVAGLYDSSLPPPSKAQRLANSSDASASSKGKDRATAVLQPTDGVHNIIVLNQQRKHR
jgi:hypothetical protein